MPSISDRGTDNNNDNIKHRILMKQRSLQHSPPSSRVQIPPTKSTLIPIDTYNL